MSDYERDFVHASIVENLNEEYQYSRSKRATFLVRSVIEKSGQCVTGETLERFACSCNLREGQTMKCQVYGDTEAVHLMTLLNDTLIGRIVEIAPRVYSTEFWHNIALPLGFEYAVQNPSSASIGSNLNYYPPP